MGVEESWTNFIGIGRIEEIIREKLSVNHPAFRPFFPFSKISFLALARSSIGFVERIPNANQVQP